MSYEYNRNIIVYPHYIDANKTVAEGRRIPKPKACERPDVMEMLDCCKYLKLPAEIEDKHYPRDWMIRGRLRVQLYRPGTKEPVNPEVPTRRALLLKMAELVPKHPARSRRAPASAPKVEAQPSAAGSSSTTTSGKVGGKGNKKKKGK